MRARSFLIRSFWTGAAAGFLAGAADSLWSWTDLSQFLPSLGGRIACALFAACLYAMAGAAATFLLTAGGIGFARFTRFGAVAGAALERHREAQSKDQRQALFPLSFVLAFVPLATAALAAAYSIGLQTMIARHHRGLIVAVIIAITAGFLILAVLLAFLIGRAVEALLALAARGRAGRILSHPAAPGAAVLLLFAASAGAGWRAAHETLDLLQLRPFFAAGGTLVLAGLLWPVMGLALRKTATLSSKVRRILAAAVVVLLVIGAFAIGGSDAIRKGATAYTGASGRLVDMLRHATDWDRDGFSSLLGGGDCKAWDPSVHPGAMDLPDDGIDQDCSGSDATALRKAEDARFVPLPASVPKDANILFLSVDDVRADHVGAYGYSRPVTPAMDALAKESILFENAWAHAPSTRYSIPAILTGRYPSQILWDESVWWPGLKPGNVTMAEALKRCGLHTGAILAYRYFDPIRHMNQGFDDYDNSNAALHQGSDPAVTRGSSARELADLAIQYLDKHAGERFFLWVHFYDPHYEYEAHPGIPLFGHEKIDLYDNEILFTDVQLSRVIDRLRELGLYDKTIIAVTADHGEGFGEHGIQFHGYHLYAAQTKIPLFIRVPGLQPARVSMPVGHVDLLPTFVNLAGGKPEIGLFGQSLLSEMAGLAPRDRDRDVLQEVIYEGPTERRAVATKQWHLIYNMEPDNTFELYDIGKDPMETKDQWGSVDAEPLRKRFLDEIAAARLPPESYVQIAKAVLKQRPKPSIRVNADFDESIRLLGADVSRTTVKRGGELEITWYFECLKPVTGRWKMLVHFNGPGLFFIGDHEPVGGALPFDSWQKGQIIADRQTVRVPIQARPGDYSLFAGIYWKHLRMPVRNAERPNDGQNRIQIATLSVTP